MKTCRAKELQDLKCKNISENFYTHVAHTYRVAQKHSYRETLMCTNKSKTILRRNKMLLFENNVRKGLERVFSC